MKIAIITDTHWGARNDSQAFTNYFVKFYEDIFFPTLLERDIRTVVHMGDIVDRRKFINYKTCLLYTSPSPRDPKISRMPSSA